MTRAGATSSKTALPPAKPAPLKGAGRRAPAAARKAAKPAAHPADVEQAIYQSVFDGVLNQKLSPGTKLPEPALCSLFGVSRAVVRKVLQRLEHDGIVEHRPNRGAVVAAPTPEETRQIFEARRALERTLVELAVKNNAGKNLGEIYGLLAAEREALQHVQQPTWARQAAAFHLTVAALGKNPILLTYLTELISRCALIVALYEPAGNAHCEHDEHTRIVEFIAKGDATSAVAEMDAHLRDLESRIRLDRPPSARSLAQMLSLA